MLVTSGAASLAYDIDGEPADQPDLLLIHAGVTDRRSWRPLIAALGEGRRIVSFDQRGYGETTYQMEPFNKFDDALAVMDAVGLEDPVVVGASMGGKAAIDLALEHPDRVAALVLIGPAISGAPDGGPFDEPLASMDTALDTAFEAGDFDEVNRLEAHLWLDGPTAPEGRVGGETRALFLEMNRRALTADDPGDDAREMDAWQRLEELTMPILVLVGDLDLPFIIRNCHQIRDRAKDARLVELHGVAHLPHFEADPACFAEIKRFLGAL